MGIKFKKQVINFIGHNNNMISYPLNEALIVAILDNQPDAVVYFAPVFLNGTNKDVKDFKIVYCNKEAASQAGLQRDELRGQMALSVPGTDESTRHLLFEQLKQVYESGKPNETSYYNKFLDKHFRVKRLPVENGVLTVALNITTEVRERQEKQRQAEMANLILNNSLNAWFSCQAIENEKGEIIDFLITSINQEYIRIIGLPKEEVVGKSYLSLFPSSKDNGTFDLNCQVLLTGKSIRHQMYYKGDGLDSWYDVAITKLGEKELYVNFANITEFKNALAEVEKKNKLLDNILRHSANGISVTQIIRDSNGNVIDGRTILANDAAVNFTGIPKHLYFSKTAVELEPNIRESAYFKMCVHTLETGEPVQTQYLLESTGRWLEISISRMDADHIITIFTDVTSSREAQLAIEHSANQLQTIINRTQSGICTIIPEVQDGVITDFRFVIVNRTIASYVNTEPGKLVGQLGSQWFPDYKRNGLFDLFCDTLESKQVNRMEFHYSSGSLDAWIDIMCTPFEEGVLITLTDYTDVKKLQLEMGSVVEELKRSNNNLEEFAHAASHDLKEPVRKIQFFTERLKSKISDRLNTEEVDLLSRMEKATERMRLLIDDLLQYSLVNQRHAEIEKVDLNKKLTLVLEDLEVQVKEKQAVINIGTLPEVMGYRRQLQQMFQNLISNAIKYNKPNEIPVISITSRQVLGVDSEMNVPSGLWNNPYYLIEVSDNGIGFDQQDAERIFNMFTRLHGRYEYSGTGVGLSIVKKVVENHHGFIKATSEPGKGSTFSLLLPVIGSA
jgi:signal transduction histidine kinase